MRPLNEIQDPAKLLGFAKSKRLLQFSSPESIGEITALLYRTVVLADKQMPIKAYLDMVRATQSDSRMMELLKSLHRIQAEITAEPGTDRKAVHGVLMTAFDVVGDVRKSLQTKIKDLQSLLNPYPTVIQPMQGTISKLRPLAFEDEFILAVAYLDLEVSKLGAITYLKGESPDYRETKRNRTLLDTGDESVLKNISAGLTRPNTERGTVEMNMITSAYNRLIKLEDLHAAMPTVIKMLNDGATKLDVMRSLKIGFRQAKLTLTDYDIISRMARREKLITFRNRRKDPANSYELRNDNHLRIKGIADKLGITPRRALNQVLDDFFNIADKEAFFGSSKARTKASKAT
jgi:hypothetical protein